MAITTAYIDMTTHMRNSSSVAIREVATRAGGFPLIPTELIDFLANIILAIGHAIAKGATMLGKLIFSRPDATWDENFQPLETLIKVGKLFIGFLSSLLFSWTAPGLNNTIHAWLGLVTPAALPETAEQKTKREAAEKTAKDAQDLVVAKAVSAALATEAAAAAERLKANGGNVVSADAAKLKDALAAAETEKNAAAAEKKRFLELQREFHEREIKRVADAAAKDQKPVKTVATEPKPAPTRAAGLLDVDLAIHHDDASDAHAAASSAQKPPATLVPPAVSLLVPSAHNADTLPGSVPAPSSHLHIGTPPKGQSALDPQNNNT